MSIDRTANHSSLNGWLFIDGGGNRQAFDIELAAEADLCLLPFRASEEDLDTVASDLQRLPNALAWQRYFRRSRASHGAGGAHARAADRERRGVMRRAPFQDVDRAGIVVS